MAVSGVLQEHKHTTLDMESVKYTNYELSTMLPNYLVTCFSICTLRTYYLFIPEDFKLHMIYT